MLESAAASPAPGTAAPSIDTGTHGTHSALEQAGANDAPPPAADPAPAPPAAPKETPSKAFAAVARREQALQRQREQIAQEKAAVAAEKAAIAQARQDMDARYGTKPKTPQEALERYGFSYQDATQHALNPAAPPTAEQLARATQEELAEFKRQQVERETNAAKAAEQQATAQVQETLQSFQGEIEEFVKGNPGEYELIALHSAQNVVYDTVEAYHSKTGNVLSIKEASDLVEKYLVKQARAALGTKYFKDLTPPPAAQAAQPSPGKPQAAQAPAQPRRTLSNELTPTTTPALGTSENVMDNAMKRALAALGG